MNVLGKLLASAFVLTLFSTSAFALSETVPSEAELDPDVTAKLAAVDTLRAYANRVETYLAKSKAREQRASSARVYDEPTFIGGQPPKGIRLGSKAALAPFVCTNGSTQSCEIQKFIHEQQSRDSSPVYYDQGKYKVDVYYRNDKSYPTRYTEQVTFNGLSQEESNQLSQRLIQRFLGDDYEAYSPAVLVSTDENIGITIYVSSPDELQPFVDNDLVRHIYHGGNSEVEEVVGGGLMPAKTLDGKTIKQDD